MSLCRREDEPLTVDVVTELIVDRDTDLLALQIRLQRVMESKGIRVKELKLTVRFK